MNNNLIKCCSKIFISISIIAYVIYSSMIYSNILSSTKYLILIAASVCLCIGVLILAIPLYRYLKEYVTLKYNKQLNIYMFLVPMILIVDVIIVMTCSEIGVITNVGSKLLVLMLLTIGLLVVIVSIAKFIDTIDMMLCSKLTSLKSNEEKDL